MNYSPSIHQPASQSAFGGISSTCIYSWRCQSRGMRRSVVARTETPEQVKHAGQESTVFGGK